MQEQGSEAQAQPGLNLGTPVEIPTHTTLEAQPLRQSTQIFSGVLVLAAIAMALIGLSDHFNGILNRWDYWMLPLMAGQALVSAWVIRQYPEHLWVALRAGLLVLLIYCEGLLAQSIGEADLVQAYTLASTIAVLPGIYIGVYFVLDRHEARTCWLIYATLMLQCLYGLWVQPRDGLGAAQTQMFWIVLVSHPCIILSLNYLLQLKGQLQAARAASIQAKERFLSVVSHELRTPLQTIVSSLELIEAAPPGPIFDRARKRVKGAATALETQVRDLTAFTRLELTQDLQIAPLDLAELAALVIDTHLVSAQRKGLTLDAKTGRLSRPKVMADPARLQQILDNLVSNALKYTDTGGVVLGLDQTTGGMTHCWVQDTGKGIPKEKLALVFEPFVRLKPDGQEKIEGSGLGLAIVRQLVGTMKGRVLASSHVGQGTRIDILLPLPGAPMASADPDTQIPQRVLVADDDPGILTAISDLLQFLGVKDVQSASDGEQALALLHTQPFDMALVDLQMPAKSGYDVAAAISETRLNASTPLIAMSAIDLNRGTPGGQRFNGYLSKPVSKAALEDVLIQARPSRR
jgi:signal transduction histidine kinase/CheY-like chemotaxis protein